MSEGDAGGGGTAGGVGGDEEAVWRDLIARYEMPVDADAASVPWPDREDLPDGPDDSAADSTSGDGADDGGNAASEGSTSGGTGGRPSASEGSAQGDGPAGTGSAASSDTDDGGGDSGDDGDSEDRSSSGGTGNGDRAGARGGNPGAGAEARPVRPGQAPGAGRTRVIRPATPPPPPPPPGPAAPSGLASRPSPAGNGDGGEHSAEDDIGEHFIPPPPPPMPHLDPVAKGAWTALFGGPAYLFVSTLIGWKAPSWAALLAVAAFVGGFAVIVLRLGDRPSRGDGPDNGAVL